jgi:hypothetical protein
VKVFFKGNLDWDAEKWREDFPRSEQAWLKVS